MGTVTVVNLTDAALQSKISNAGSTHSGINGILPNTYYHHNALSGTGYDVTVNWYVPGVTEDYPSSDLARIGWYVAGAFVAFVGLVLTVATLGVAGPLTTTITGTLVWSGLSAGSAMLVGSLPVATITFLTGGTLMTLFGPTIALMGLDATQKLREVVADLPELRFPYTIWGQSNDFLPVEGKLPLSPIWVDDPGDPSQKKLDGWKLDKDVLARSPLTFATTDGQDKMSEGRFDSLRRSGAIYQIKHVTQDYELRLSPQSEPVPFKEGEFTDCTQGIVRTNLTAAGGPSRSIQAHAGGPTLDVSSVYRIRLNPGGSTAENDQKSHARASILMAGADEGDHRVYLKHGSDSEVRDGQSCCYWQLIPTREHGGGWLLVDRRYVRFLALRGDEILQYQSNEINGLVLDTEGWATNVSKPEMVWRLVTQTDGSVAIRQSGSGRDRYVTARTDGGLAIYARTEHDGDVYQRWTLEAHPS